MVGEFENLEIGGLTKIGEFAGLGFEDPEILEIGSSATWKSFEFYDHRICKFVN